MIGWRPPSSLGNLACRLRKDACASLSVFCDESCTTCALVDVSAPPRACDGAVAVRVRFGAAGAGSALWASSDNGARDAALERGAVAVAGDAAPCGRPLTSVPSGRMVTVRTFLGSFEAPAGCWAGV